jgi:hypothetical protein
MIGGYRKSRADPGIILAAPFVVFDNIHCHNQFHHRIAHFQNQNSPWEKWLERQQGTDFRAGCLAQL